MSNIETSFETRVVDTNSSFEHPILIPELCENLVGLIDELPSGSRIGIECSQKMIGNFSEKVVHKCEEKGIAVVGLLDEALCVKRQQVFNDFKRGFQEQKIPETKKPYYYGQEQKVKAILDYFTVNELPYGILKNIQKDNFDLIILSRETLKYFGDDVKKISPNKEIRLIICDFKNYPERIDNSYGYKPSDKSKILYNYLSSF